MKEPALLIRADANVAMGTGHVMRCLALAQAWQASGGRCVFAMAQSTPAVESRLREQGIDVEHLGALAGSTEDARQTADIASNNEAVWIVVDGYQFDFRYQAAIKAFGFNLLLLDDNGHAAPYSVDLILNQNFHARPELYAQRDPSTQLLLGPRYAMLRKEFRAWRGWHRDNVAAAKKILITMGGSDPDNATCLVIEALKSITVNREKNLNLETTVLVGGSNPHLAEVEKLIASEKSPMRLIVDAPNVGEWMAWADIAISGAGTTVWELCFLGLPSLLLVLAPNQEEVAAAAERMNIAWSLGNLSDLNSSITTQKIIAEKISALLNSFDVRMAQSRNGQKLVDGRGAERVVAYLSDLQLRPTSDSDCELFWEWANDANARAASFRNKAISWEHHAQWFKAKMEDPNAVLYTAMKQTAPNHCGPPMGQVRYQIEGNRAVLSISLAAAFRGQGWGQKILTLAIGRLFVEREPDFIDAFVKPTNSASLKLFENAGFERMPPAIIEGQQAVHFVLQRNALGEQV